MPLEHKIHIFSPLCTILYRSDNVRIKVVRVRLYTGYCTGVRSRWLDIGGFVYVSGLLTKREVEMAGYWRSVPGTKLCVYRINLFSM